MNTAKKEIASSQTKPATTTVSWSTGEWHALFSAIVERRTAIGFRYDGLTANEGLLTDVRHTELTDAQNIVFAAQPERKRATTTKRAINDACARALETFRYVPESVQPVKAQTGWGPLEWAKVCAELVRVNPIVMLKVPTLAGIDSEDIATAGRKVLPGVKMQSISLFRARTFLIEALSEYRAKFETPKPAEVKPTVVAEIAATSTADSLMNCFAAEVAKKMLPEVEAVLAARIEARLLPKIEAMLISMFDRLSPMIGTVTAPGLAAKTQEFRPEPKPYRPRIAIVGAPAHLKQKLVVKVPGADFVCLDSDSRNITASVRNCDLVVAMIDNLQHSDTDLAQRAVDASRFKRVSGGESAVVRQIHLWFAETELSKI